MSMLPTGLTAGLTGHVGWHNLLHDRENKRLASKAYNPMDYGVLADGSNDTTAWLNAIAAVPHGGCLLMPQGVSVVDPILCTKALTLVGFDPFSCWFKPSSNYGSAVWTFQLPAPGSAPFGTERGYYGGGMRGVGFDLSAAPLATALKTDYVNSGGGWMRFNDLYMKGGAIHVDHSVPNCRFRDIRGIDAGKWFKINGNTGLEVTLKDCTYTRQGAGTTSQAIEIIGTLSSGNGGDIRLDNVQIGSVMGGAVLSAGVLIQQAGNVSIPVFAHKLIVDNCAGPALKLVNIKDVTFENCWFNSSAGATCAVQITAGGNLRFLDSDYFGGSGGAGTYEFLGSVATAGFTSRGNNCPSGPVYRFTGTGGVTDLIADDTVPGATAVSQVTNDEAKFLAGAARRWGKVWLQQVPIVPAEQVHFVGASGEPPFTSPWAAVAGTLVWFWKDPNGTVFMAGRMTGGSSGTSAFTLPAGWRPGANEFFATDGGSVQITTGGLVILAGTTVGVSGISFRQGN